MNMLSVILVGCAWMGAVVGSSLCKDAGDKCFAKCSWRDTGCYNNCGNAEARCESTSNALAEDGRPDIGSKPTNSMNIYGDPQQTNMNDDNDRKCEL